MFDIVLSAIDPMLPDATRPSWFPVPGVMRDRLQGAGKVEPLPAGAGRSQMVEHAARRIRGDVECVAGLPGGRQVGGREGIAAAVHQQPVNAALQGQVVERDEVRVEQIDQRLRPCARNGREHQRRGARVGRAVDREGGIEAEPAIDAAGELQRVDQRIAALIDIDRRSRGDVVGPEQIGRIGLGRADASLPSLRLEPTAVVYWSPVVESSLT